MIYLTLEGLNVIEVKTILSEENQNVLAISSDGKRIRFLDVIKIDYGVIDNTISASINS